MEKASAYQKGVSGRETKWQRAATETEMEALKKEATGAINACEETHTLLLANDLQEREKVTKKEIKETIERLRLQNNKCLNF